MKMYNTITTAHQLSVGENGGPESWNAQGLSNREFFETYLGNFLKIASYCTDAASCGVTSSSPSIKPLNAKTLGDMTEEEMAELDLSYSSISTSSQAAVLLQDGSLVVMQYHEGQPQSTTLIDILVDTNGPKGPNTFGRDIFELIMRESNNYTYKPVGSSFTYEELTSTGAVDEICSTSKPSDGESCGARLLLDGKMDY